VHLGLGAVGQDAVRPALELGLHRRQNDALLAGYRRLEAVAGDVGASMRLAPTFLLTALVLAAPAPAVANTVPNRDHHFLLETAEGAHFEITMGKIVARNGYTREARAAGRVIVRDHSGELHALEALTMTVGVKLPSAPSILQEHEIGNTSKHTGAAFNRAYARLEVGDPIGDIQSADGEMVTDNWRQAAPFPSPSCAALRFSPKPSPLRAMRSASV
jgi:predicted outer membrane protein